MSEAVYDTVNVNGEPEYEQPFGGTELYEHQYIELQQPEGAYEMARVEEPSFQNGRLLNNTESHQPQYMEIQQTERVFYDMARVSEQIQQNALDGTILNTESQYMELKQLEGDYDTVTERKVCSKLNIVK